MADMTPGYQSQSSAHRLHDTGQINLSESGRQGTIYSNDPEVSQTHNAQGSSFSSPNYSQRSNHLPVQDHLQAPRHVVTGVGIPMAGPMLQFGIPASNPSHQQQGVPFSNQVPSGFPIANQQHQPRVEAVQGWPTTSAHPTDHSGTYSYQDIHQPLSQHSSLGNQQQTTQVLIGRPSHNQIQGANVMGGGYNHHTVGVQQAHAFNSPVLGIPATPQAVANFNHVSQGTSIQSFLTSPPLNSPAGFHQGSSTWEPREQFQSTRQQQKHHQQHDGSGPYHHSPQDLSAGFSSNRNGQYSSRRF